MPTPTKPTTPNLKVNLSHNLPLSRPSKNSPAPPPFYLLLSDSAAAAKVRYCASCGRVMSRGREGRTVSGERRESGKGKGKGKSKGKEKGTRRIGKVSESENSTSRKGDGLAGAKRGEEEELVEVGITEKKFCSARCRRLRAGSSAVGREIEEVFVRLLNGLDGRDADVGEEEGDDDGEEMEAGEGNKPKAGSGRKSRRNKQRSGGGASAGNVEKKGESSRIVFCSEVEEIVFGSSRADVRRMKGDRRRKASEVGDEEEEACERGVGGGPERGVINDDDAEAAVEALRIDDGMEYLSSSSSSLSLDTDADSEDGSNSTSTSTTHTHTAHHSHIAHQHKSKPKPKPQQQALNPQHQHQYQKQKQQEGLLRANNRELVRCAARRGVVFGFLMTTTTTNIGTTDTTNTNTPPHTAPLKKHNREKSGVPVMACDNKDVGDAEFVDNDNDYEMSRPLSHHEQQRRKCEAVQGGRVVESSFAKGEWGVRWRE